MPIGGLHADTSAMNMNGKDTIQNAELFSQELSSLRNNIDSLMNIWRGPSASSFQTSYEQQSQNLSQFQQLLNEMGEGIVKGADILNRTEEENASAGAHLF